MKTIEAGRESNVNQIRLLKMWLWSNQNWLDEFWKVTSWTWFDVMVWKVVSFFPSNDDLTWSFGLIFPLTALYNSLVLVSTLFIFMPFIHSSNWIAQPKQVEYISGEIFPSSLAWFSISPPLTDATISRRASLCSRDHLEDVRRSDSSHSRLHQTENRLRSTSSQQSDRPLQTGRVSDRSGGAQITRL